MAKAPLNPMEVLGNQLLCGGLLAHIKRGKALISMPPQNREATMRAGV